MRTDTPAPNPQASHPGFKPPQTFPGLTKNRVELVPWSTAPTKGPKTAFFAAAMKPASDRLAVAVRIPGDGDRQEGAGSRGGRAGGNRRTPRPRSGGPFSRAEPSHPTPRPEAPPAECRLLQWEAGFERGGARADESANELTRQEADLSNNRRQEDVTEAGPGARRGWWPARRVTWGPPRTRRPSQPCGRAGGGGQCHPLAESACGSWKGHHPTHRPGLLPENESKKAELPVLWWAESGQSLWRVPFHLDRSPVCPLPWLIFRKNLWPFHH